MSGAHLRVHALGGSGFFGVATSRQLGCRARRNRFRRRLREAGLATLELWSGLDLVVVAKASCEGVGLGDLVLELGELSVRARGILEEGLG